MSTSRRKARIPLKICVASLKGGGGKSTLASNLAVTLQRQGRTVALIDVDPAMNTTVQWSDDRNEFIEENPRRDDVAPLPTVKKTGRTKDIIVEMAKSYDVVIVDTGGQDSSEMRSALGVVDLVLTPVEPGQDSLDGVAPFLELIERARDFNEDLQALAVLSRLPPGGSRKRVDDARDYLAQFDDDLLVAESVITNRVVYLDIKPQGLSVVETRNSAAKDEMEALTREVLAAVKGV